jgi:hypothetical protein
LPMISQCDLSPRRPFYQAELRPEAVEEHCLFIENREEQLPMISQYDLSPRRPFYQAELRPAEANTVATSAWEANTSACANESSDQQT